MELIKESISIGKTADSGTQQIMCDGNIIVPDSKADILKVVQVDARACITDRVIREGKISLSGKVNLNILYIPEAEGERLSSMSGRFDFSESISSKSASGEMRLMATATVSRAEFSVINSRKLNIKNIIVLDYELIGWEDCEIAADFEEDTAEKQIEKINIQNATEIRTHDFVLEEEVDLPQGQKTIGELLKCDINITDTEYKTVAGRIILKGVLSVCALYIAADGEAEHAEAELPFTELIESENISDNMDCDIDYEIITCQFAAAEDNDGDMRVISLNVSASAQVKASESVSLEFIKDCYVPYCETRLETERITAFELAAKQTEQYTVRETVDFPRGIPSVRSVYNVVMTPHVTKSEMNGAKLVTEGRIDAYVLYLSESADNPVYSIRHEIPFGYAMDTSVQGNELTAQVKVKIKHSGYTLNAAGEVELRCIIGIWANILKKREINAITEAEAEELSDEKQGSIKIYFANKGDNVWDIAKKYAVPLRRLTECNELEDDKTRFKSGERLFIPGR